MAKSSTPKAGQDCLPEPTTFAEQWARSAQEFSRWQIALLDSQTAWWKDMERGTMDLMKPWLGSDAQSWAQPAMGKLEKLPAPAWPVDIQQAWNTWSQVWMNALGHDTSRDDAPRSPR